VKNLDELVKVAKTHATTDTLPPASAIRTAGTRRKRNRRALTTIAIAACGAAILGLSTQLPWFPPVAEPADNGGVELISYPRADVPSSQVTGAFALEDECLYFGGAAAVVPRGTTLDGKTVTIAGTSPTSVTVGNEVTIGGANMPMAEDVIGNYVTSNQRDTFTRCLEAAAPRGWVLITN
jgi:hypothetical protein